ncbi:MAG: D-alanyl-D-alanine-carboxypeptidase/endopeptidase AmpH [Chlamydiia bacterium]|nr:D-alanyl-D-alanine-carboxypeptidase/endopeptidase AmpH [Chlamydiia bacterium]
MKRTIFLSLLIFCSAFLCSFKEADAKKEIDAACKKYIKDKNIRGLSASVIKASYDLESPFEKTFYFGHSRKSPQTNVKEPTQFRLGDLSKMFVAALLCHFIETEELHLSDTLEKHLPKSFKMPDYHGEKVTLFQLATHTSSLPKIPTIPMKDYQVSVKEIQNYLKSFKFPKKPGSRYELSDLGYGLLVYIMERVSSSSFEDLIKEHLLNPLAISTLYTKVPASALQRLCEGYKGLFPVKEHFVDKDWCFFKPTRGLVSNTVAMHSWMKFLLKIEKTPLDHILKHLLQISYTFEESSVKKAAFPFIVTPLSSDKALTTYSIGGSYHGFTSHMAFIPDTRIGVVILSNADENVEPLAKDLLDILSN